MLLSILSYIPIVGWLFGLYTQNDTKKSYYHSKQALAILIFNSLIAIVIFIYSFIIPFEFTFIIEVIYIYIIIQYILSLLIGIIFVVKNTNEKIPFYSKIADRFPF